MAGAEGRVAVLVDCENLEPGAAEHALRVVAQFGRVVLRRGYGNHQALANRWQAALARLAFTPCLQYQYAAGKNTSDIALALDAMEAMFDGRADTFCLVTSDPDFAYLCRKLRERGGNRVHRRRGKDSGCAQKCQRPILRMECFDCLASGGLGSRGDGKQTADGGAEPVKIVIKRRPKFVVDAVDLLAGGASEGKVSLGALGSYLKRTDPAFSPQIYGRSGLLNMIRTYDLLTLQPGGRRPLVRREVSGDRTERHGVVSLEYGRFRPKAAVGSA